MDEKVCIKCHNVKPTNDFHRRYKDNDNHRLNICKKCMLLYLKVYKTKTRDNPSKSWYWCSRASSLNSRNKRKNCLKGKRIGGAELRRKFKDKHECWLCGKPLFIVDAWLDHTIPISRGGEHNISNIEMFCRPCNELKNTFLLDELLTHIRLILSRFD